MTQSHQVELTDLVPHVTGDKRNGRLHFGHDSLSFIDPIEASRTEMFVLGNDANRRNWSPDIEAMSGPLRRTPRSRSTK